MGAESKKHILFIIALVVVSVAATGYLAYENSTLQNIMGQQAVDTAQTTSELQNTITMLQEETRNLRNELEEALEANEELREDLEDEEDKNERFEDQIRDLAGTVGDLDKLSKTDEELLQKYSKVYFLNEHYVPEELDEIDSEYLYSEDRDQYLHSAVMPFFEDMVEDAADDDINLWVVSAFRSFETQSGLKGQYTVTYGSGANTFSADQGYSEHQLGTTIDFTTNGLGGGLQGFETTKAYEWLVDNAHEYGFVLSYPEENTYYVFEPWHWRFVGTDLAEELDDENEYFYDMNQREIDKYLISIFD